MKSLIYDRTELDVINAKQNPSSDLHLKGNYNYTDLNRLEEWCNYLQYLLSKSYKKVVLNLKLDKYKYEKYRNKRYVDLATQVNIKNPFELLGDTTQDGTPTPSNPQEIENVTGRQVIDVVGKNLLDISQKLNSTNRGIDYILNDDGSITLNGTATATYSYVTSTVTLTEPLKIGTYTYSIDHIISGQWRIIITYDDNTQETKAIMPGNTSITFTTTKKITKYYVSFSNITQGATYNETLFIQLEYSSTPTTYEPYKSNTYEVNLGKNLLPTNESFWEQGSISNNGSHINRTTVLRTKDFINIDGTTNYYVSIQNENYTFVNLMGYSQDGTFKAVYYNTDINIYGTRSLKINFNNSDVSKIKVLLRKSDDSTIIPSEISSIEPMIEKGSQATSYSPYFTPIALCKIEDYQDYIRRSTGKNLFDKNSPNIKTGYFLDSNGVETQTSYGWEISDYIKIEPNAKYTASGIITVGSSPRSCYYDENKNFISSFRLTNTTITVPSNAYYIRLSISTATNDANTLQFELGNTSTDLEPYGVGKWYKYGKIGKVVLNGSESWYGGSSQTNTIRFDCVFTNNGLPINDNKIICNKFNSIYNDTSDIEHCRNTNSSFPNTIVIYINKSRLSSLELESFKTWLSTNNVEVYYVLATPTIEEITNTELIEQLEKIYYAEAEYIFDMFFEYIEYGSWKMSDIPTLDEINRIRNNIQQLKDKFTTKSILTIVSDDTMNYIQANILEQILSEINELFPLYQKSLQYCGTFYCGQKTLR